MSKQRWKQRDIKNGAIWSDWHRTGPDGGVLLVTYVPLRYHRHKQVGNGPNTLMVNVRVVVRKLKVRLSVVAVVKDGNIRDVVI